MAQKSRQSMIPGCAVCHQRNRREATTFQTIVMPQPANENIRLGRFVDLLGNRNRRSCFTGCSRQMSLPTAEIALCEDGLLPSQEGRATQSPYLALASQAQQRRYGPRTFLFVGCASFSCLLLRYICVQMVSVLYSSSL